MRADLAAAILAGGKARRFGGRDKSRLVVQSHSIINRQVDVLQQVVTQIFVVAADAGRFADLGLPVVPDLIPGLGALGGIHTAIERSPAERVIVIACDLPFLHPGLLARLADRCENHDAAWVHGPRGAEPLLACYRRTAGPAVRQAIDAGQLRAEIGRAHV